MNSVKIVSIRATVAAKVSLLMASRRLEVSTLGIPICYSTLILPINLLRKSVPATRKGNLVRTRQSLAYLGLQLVIILGTYLILTLKPLQVLKTSRIRIEQPRSQVSQR
jgi:hypothetical protein